MVKNVTKILSSCFVEVGYDSGHTQSMKTAISIPDEVFRAAEELSRRLRMSRSALYSQAVAAFIASHRSTGVREKLDAIYGEEDSALDPLLAHWQALALPREDW
jgi:metal-responsive CopG/Arc/MetJ family transcriptional regulator